jgi:hypothetical protein
MHTYMRIGREPIGVIEALPDEDGNYHVGVSLARPGDRWDRRLGRLIAANRAKASLEGRAKDELGERKHPRVLKLQRAQLESYLVAQGLDLSTATPGKINGERLKVIASMVRLAVSGDLGRISLHRELEQLLRRTA